MAGIKIVDLPAVGRDLAATDLFEMSLVGGTGSRKITGQEIMNASKLSVNNTPVINGTAGRIFFQDAANVLQQSANLFWDETNGRLGIGTSTPFNGLNAIQSLQLAYGTSNIDVGGFCSLGKITQSGYGAVGSNYYLDNLNALRRKNADSVSIIDFSSAGFYFRNSPGGATNSVILLTELASIRSNGNMLINTVTDAGYKLDVNGTARVVGPTLAVGDWTSRSTSVYVRALAGGTENRGFYIGKGASNDGNVGSFTFQDTTNTLNIRSPYNNGTIAMSFEGNTNSIQFHNQSGTAISKFFSNTGNWGIGTTTDNGYKIEVVGTGRFSSSINVGGNGTTGSSSSAGFIVQDNGNTVGSSFVHCQSARLSIFANPQAFAAGFEPSSGGISSTNALAFMSSSTTRMKITTTGNVLINTTTDAGFRLDVNGTSIVRGILNVGTINTGFSFSGADCIIFNNGGSQGAISLAMGGDNYFRIYQPINAGSGVTSGTINTITTPITYAWASGTASPNLFQLNPNYNFTGTYSGIVRGFYYNPSLTSMTGVTHYAIHSTSGRVRLEGLPTSPTGLTAGDLWNNGGVINIV